MSKTYEDLSRRALVKLDHDYDRASKGALSKYLSEHEDEYENIRPVEKVVNCYDTVVSTVSRSVKAVKKSYDEEGSPKAAVRVLNAVADNVDVIAGGIKVISSIATTSIK